MKRKTDKLYLTHILQAAESIAEYCNSITFEDFLKSKEKQDAIIRQIEIIGEATKRLSHELVEKHSNFPWSFAARMRDKLIHDYFQVDLNEVWNTATKDVPGYKNKVEGILSKNNR